MDGWMQEWKKGPGTLADEGMDEWMVITWNMVDGNVFQMVCNHTDT